MAKVKHEEKRTEKKVKITPKPEKQGKKEEKRDFVCPRCGYDSRSGK